jgi:hypothetical protein
MQRKDDGKNSRLGVLLAIIKTLPFLTTLAALKKHWGKGQAYSYPDFTFLGAV